MPEKYEYQGEEYLWEQVPDCILLVSYRNLEGLVGPILDPSDSHSSFGYTSKTRVDLPSKGLLQSSIQWGYASSPEEAFHRLCETLKRQYDQEESRKGYDFDEACQRMNDYIKSLEE